MAFTISVFLGNKKNIYICIKLFSRKTNERTFEIGLKNKTFIIKLVDDTILMTLFLLAFLLNIN